MLEQRLARLASSKQKGLLQGGKKGLEKESLRVSPDGHVAQTDHPLALGSTLTHPHITTDYSEALLEFVTAPFADLTDALEQLGKIHQFVYNNIGDELLWSTSMPCIVRGAKSIPLARYGDSNVGRMKHIYRRGLDHRYGRIMQAISGVHFNYSVPDHLWPHMQEQAQNRGPQQQFISSSYLALARNVQRYEWLIAYLFGNSPALCRSFMDGSSAQFQRWDETTYYEPYATSLRMSDIGYKNNLPIALQVSYNSLDSYIAGLRHAVETSHPPYEEIGVVVDGEYRQLNANILQIENEYYSTIRPKQVTQSGEKPTMALQRRGVQYVELRALDINTFEPSGVGRTQAYFLEAFSLFCLLQESAPIEQNEQKELEQNQSLVATQGRKPKLALQDQGRSRSLQGWATEILDAMDGICEMLDEGLAHRPYEQALSEQREAVQNAESTPSARVLEEMRANRESFFDFSMRVSQQHQEAFKAQQITDTWQQKFVAMAQQSIIEQQEIEANDRLSFEEYLEAYFGQQSVEEVG